TSSEGWCASASRRAKPFRLRYGARSMRRSSAALLLAAALVAGACSGTSEAPPPGLALAQSLPAQSRIHPLLKAWAAALTREERAKIAPDLEAFLRDYSDDGQAPAAEALLGWVAVERGDLDLAIKLAHRAAGLGAGSWQDFAQLVEGAVQHRKKDAAGA